MKKILFIVLLSFSLTSLSNLFAQNMKFDSLAYVFTDFVEGRITLKDGSQVTTLLNYGYRGQDLLYYDNEKKEMLQLNNLQDILLIRAGNRYFIPVMSGIGELIIYGDICLVYYKKLNLHEMNKSTSYGSTSTAAIQDATAIKRSGTNLDPDYNLTYYYSTSDPNKRTLSQKVEAGEIRLIIQEDFYLSEIGDTKVVPLTKKNLIKKFPSQASFIESYFEENKPNLQNKLDASRLVDLLNNSK
jgi:hypothetical protein